MTPAPDRLRGPFVGRETQLGALVSAVDAAGFGEIVLALVAGEPGIGKTRLVNEVAARVSARVGARVLWGTCWEGEGAPAYWPWLQLLRALLADRKVDRPEAAGGPGDGRVHRLLEQVPSPDVDADARFRLFDTVAGVLAETTRTGPLVLVIDDLHWADEASIRLLQFLARDVRMHRLAILGTYRDTDLDPAHPLARCLGELGRDGLHVSLAGLGRRHVATLVAALTGEDADQTGMVPLLHRRSGGNPFFVRELLRLLEAEGSPEGFDLDRSLDRGPGCGSDRGPGRRSAAAVPVGVRAVVDRRLSRLSSPTRDVLSAASVIGAEFEPFTLGPVTGRSADEVLAALDEAAAARLVVRREDGVGFGFVHALVREVLYDGLSMSSRVALHRGVAE
jgi:predicted ATPase